MLKGYENFFVALGSVLFGFIIGILWDRLNEEKRQSHIIFYIIDSFKKELEDNCNFIHERKYWLKKDQDKPLAGDNVVGYTSIKKGVWDSLMGSGELKYLSKKSPDILEMVSHAYTKIIDLNNASYLVTQAKTLHKEWFPESTLIYLEQEALSAINDALKEIEKWGSKKDSNLISKFKLLTGL